MLPSDVAMVIDSPGAVLDIRAVCVDLTTEMFCKNFYYYTINSVNPRLTTQHAEESKTPAGLVGIIRTTATTTNTHSGSGYNSQSPKSKAQGYLPVKATSRYSYFLFPV